MAMASLLYLVIVLSFPLASALQSGNPNISLYSTLYPTATPSSWLSNSRSFAFGFYPEGSGFSVGAWLITAPGNITIIWTAFRDEPHVFPEGVSLNLTGDGLKLNTASGDRLVSSINTTAVSASMLDSGNFVVYGPKHEVLWQTFDSPTDTIMPGQTLTKGATLFSSLSGTDHSVGKSRLVMQADGNLVLYPVDTENDSNDAYWASNTALNPNFINSSLNLDADGRLYMQGNNGTDNLTSSNQGTSSTLEIYLARLDTDGVFRLYSYDLTQLPVSTRTLASFPSSAGCNVKVACGFNSYCTSDYGDLECVCLPGFNFTDPHDKSSGCVKTASASTCPPSTDVNITMSTLANMEWLDNYYAITSTINTTEECRDACLVDCFCDAALFQQGACTKQRLPMKYGQRDPTYSTTTYIKMVTTGLLAQDANATLPATDAVAPRPIKKVVSTKVLTVSGVVFVGLVIIIIVLSVLVCRTRQSRVPRSSSVDEVSAFPKWFSYNELSEATGGFKETLGKGSFGTVFKGVLCWSPGGNQISVAVKRLEKIVEEGEREFRAEMRAIGRTHHKNLVRLVGFCEEGFQRLLVYELMSNGSLAEIIFNTEVAARPHWSERVRIALEVARGINYLHEDCETCIIHCDIKPHNILMDTNWTAKISDFGLAKLLMPSQTRTFTEMRGTRGYLAPEWAKNAPISVKTDVYSFGIVLLEIVCCRKNMELRVAKPDEIILLDWVYNCFLGGELDKLVPEVEDVEERELERMVKVGLWCVQNEPTHRPYMKNVVLMLEGNAQVPIPPQPASVV